MAGRVGLDGADTLGEEGEDVFVGRVVEVVVEDEEDVHFVLVDGLLGAVHGVEEAFFDEEVEDEEDDLAVQGFAGVEFAHSSLVEVAEAEIGAALGFGVDGMMLMVGVTTEAPATLQFRQFQWRQHRHLLPSWFAPTGTPSAALVLIVYLSDNGP